MDDDARKKQREGKYQELVLGASTGAKRGCV